MTDWADTEPTTAWAPRPTWLDQRACADVPTNLFFPAKGDNSSVKAAKAICASCPVKAECLQMAMDNVERFGIWGGTSERERRRMRRDVRLGIAAPVLRHGTLSAYNDGCRCDDCRRVNSIYKRAWKAQRRAPINHGTYSGYVTHYRRKERPCPACIAARNSYNAARRTTRNNDIREDAA